LEVGEAIVNESLSPARAGLASEVARSDGAPVGGFRAAPLIRFERVVRRFGAVTAVDDVSLDIREGEFFCLLGPSGCGKTTLMRMLAGFEQPDAGRVLLAGEDLAGTPPHRRPVNMMFQSYALFPHLTVTGNIAFGLKQEGRRKAEIAERVAEMLRLVQLEPCATRYPQQLSGGQRQRVALARALAKRPKVLLLDEPLAALDRKLREETQFELKEIQARLGTTFLVVTHDQHEAMAMADRIAVMDQGRIVQVGAPDEIYEAPASRFVARFVGDVNLLDGRLRGREGSCLVIDSAVAPEGLFVDSAAAEAGQGGAVAVAVRPEKMAIHRERPAAERNVLAGEVVDFSYLGDWTMVRVRLDRGETVRVSRQNASRAMAAPVARGERVYLSFASDAAVVLTR
jgi:putrescine transport system ATP-binding protein